MKKYVTIISLGVRDLVKATDFYENVFGWKKSDLSNESITFIQLDGLLFSLYPIEKLAEDATVEMNESQGYNSISLAHNLKSEKEVDQLIEELESKGATIVKRPQKVFWGGYSSYITDLDGHLWEIAYNPYM